ncbi:MAG TPA: sugar transferase [Candidatus Eisenbacteria bacterium]|nr:sugar transferase [Candidatus Eisenbacteria bacterium]
MILPSGYPEPKATPDTGVRPDSWVKRALDVVLSAIGLVVMLPVFALIAIAIKLDSKGPIIYAQERIGLNRRRQPSGHRVSGNGHARAEISNGSGATILRLAPERRRREGYGRPFKIYKFRSMVTDAEKHTGAVWAAKNDSRITRVGSFLRKTRLDEFPQLWNVLRGDMSIVGPRPERAKFVVELTQTLPDYPQRCNTLPGITGLAQVKWQYDTSIETVNRKLEYDLYYVRHRRLLLDLKIMAQTVKVMARGEGAH